MTIVVVVFYLETFLGTTIERPGLVDTIVVDTMWLCQSTTEAAEGTCA